ncbi:MAG: hypothetical protein ACO326_10285 [Burkholderiaceae bacterium]|jgi:hypothetical protein
MQKPLKDLINEDGFRHWYEGELIRAFGLMALGVLLLVLGVSALEVFFNLGPGWPTDRLAALASSLLGVFLAGLCWLKFSSLIARAELLANQAVCSNCNAYGRLVVDEERLNTETMDRILKCSCQKCSHKFEMNCA